MKASSSNNPIIPGEQLESWSSWSPGSLDGFAQALTPSQLVAMAQMRKPGASLAERIAASETEAAAPVPLAEAEALAEQAEAGQELEEVDAGLGYPTAAELEAIHQEAWQAGHDAGVAAGRAEGFEQGEQAGREQGAAEARAELQPRLEEAWQSLQSMAGGFSAELSRLEQELAQDVLRLAWQLAQKLTQQQLRRDGEALLPLLQSALSELPSTLSSARLRVNPADLDAAREFLRLETPETVWQWIEDPAIARGGCVIDTTSVRLDMTMETRLAALSLALGLEAGDERAD
ncbi:flagellar assembly protein FliH [Chromobacterium alticapitis]|uniref:Flagellar assembly protein FliH n=1 Tax=Chromobacterium alticapitis TaxID=2073169 RepID=A0A2S5DBR6_9NEIS|nr:flagellar assembly protein FliH [Chromobacterium alticapitis]POZ60478.1 flagellar assembly protein FliH [Chromobacterium alticapitis]